MNRTLSQLAKKAFNPTRTQCNNLRARAFATSNKTTKQSTLAPFDAMYNPFFSSQVRYATYIVVGAIVVETVYGKLTDFVWETANKGRLYHHIDWSQFKTDDDDEDEE